MSIAAETAGTELRRGFPLVVACGFGFGLGLSSIPFYTFGVFLDPLSSAFGWSVTAIQAGMAASYLTTVVMLPVVAALANRFGVKVVACISSTLFGLAFMSLGLLDGQLWRFYAHWVLISAFGTGTLAITWSRAITGSFQTGRGLALGLALLGSGVMGVIGPSLARALIDAVGWREAYLVLGAAPILISVPLTLAFLGEGGRARPALRPAAAAPSQPPLSQFRFWLMALAFLAIAMGVAGVIPNLVKLFTTGGLSRNAAIGATSLVGIFVVLGRVACGALIDRFWAPGVAAVFLVPATMACLMLARAPVSPAAALASSAMIGLIAGAEFDLLPFLVGRYFPLQTFTTTLAALSAVFYVGAALGGPLLGQAYDRFGAYGPGVAGAAILFAFGAAALLGLGPYPATSAPIMEGDGASEKD